MRRKAPSGSRFLAENSSLAARLPRSSSRTAPPREGDSPPGPWPAPGWKSPCPPAAPGAAGCAPPPPGRRAPWWPGRSVPLSGAGSRPASPRTHSLPLAAPPKTRAVTEYPPAQLWRGPAPRRAVGPDAHSPEGGHIPIDGLGHIQQRHKGHRPGALPQVKVAMQHGLQPQGGQQGLSAGLRGPVAGQERFFRIGAQPHRQQRGGGRDGAVPGSPGPERRHTPGKTLS